jgi:hypothetical protein
MIAAARKIVAKISSIIRWPLTMLTASVVKANKRMIRWAIRKRAGWAYLLAIFWFPALTATGLIVAVFSVRQNPTEAWPVAGVAIVFVNKFLAIVLYALQQSERTVKAARHYRRHFKC